MSVTEATHAVPEERPQKSDLRLSSLEIRSFRAFHHLQIEQIGRVNLLTGRNNTGKTSVLEALYVYSHPNTGQALRDLMLARDEFTRLEAGPGYTATIQHLFHGRKEMVSESDQISLGPINSVEQTMTLRVSWKQTSTSGSEQNQIVIREPIFRIRRNNGNSEASLRPVLSWGVTPDQNRPMFIRSSGLDTTDIGRLWASVELSPGEDKILDALRIVAPQIERVSLKTSDGSTAIEVPIVRVANTEYPIPLRTLGEGMIRLVHLSLALLIARDSFLLIDEFENGLHYSIQPDVWRLIFHLASDLNVQVFATTHSWDCIEAFQKAAAEAETEEGVLIRLRREAEGIEATCFNERHLAVITRDHLEVR
jgi:ABC-type dipeptide/oligopeptide/nickel transport system ATPase subunit